jgi:hypothetical protein
MGREDVVPSLASPTTAASMASDCVLTSSSPAGSPARLPRRWSMGTTAGPAKAGPAGLAWRVYCLPPPNCATVAAYSGPGSVRTMRSLAASSFFVEGGETYGRICDQPGLPWCDHRSAAAPAATRCCPSRGLPLLPDGKIRVLAAGQPAAPGRLPRLPAAGPGRPGRRGGGRQHDDALGPERHVSDGRAGGTLPPGMPACCCPAEPAAVSYEWPCR